MLASVVLSFSDEISDDPSEEICCAHAVTDVSACGHDAVAPICVN
jgi:hypothetical protein